MTPKKLNQSLILLIYKSRTDKLDLKNIAQNFVSRNTRRQNFFGTFVWGCMCTSKEEKSEIFRRDDIDEEQRIYFQVQIKDKGGSQNYIFWVVPHFSF